MKSYSNPPDLAVPIIGRRSYTRTRMAGLLPRDMDFGYVDFSATNMSGVRSPYGELPVSVFIGTNLSNTEFVYANMLALTFSEQSNLTNMDMKGCLLLLSIYVDEYFEYDLNREWLISKGVVNANLAITSYEELAVLLNDNIINIPTAEYYRQKIFNLYVVLETVRRKFIAGIDIEDGMLPILSFATDENITILAKSHQLLFGYLVADVERSRNIPSEDLLVMLITANKCPKMATLAVNEPPVLHPQRLEAIEDTFVERTLPESLHIIINNLSPTFTSAICNQLQREDTPDNKVTLDCGMHNHLSVNIFLKFLRTRKVSKSVTVTFTNLDEDTAKSLLAILKDNDRYYGLNCFIASYAPKVSAKLINDLAEQLRKNEIKQAALVCITLRQGQQKATQPLSFLGRDVFGLFTQYCTPAFLNKNDKKSFQENIVKLCPVGLRN